MSAFFVKEKVGWLYGLPIAILSLLTLGAGIWHGRSYREEQSNNPGFIPPGGNGPYTETPCKVTRDFLTKLLDNCRDLKKVAIENNATIEWDQFKSLTEQAAGAVKKKSYNEASRFYARAISFMMKEFRFQKLKQLGTSGPADEQDD